MKRKTHLHTRIISLFSPAKSLGVDSGRRRRWAGKLGSVAAKSQLYVRDESAVVCEGAHFLKTPYKKWLEKTFRRGGAACGGGTHTLEPQDI